MVYYMNPLDIGFSQDTINRVFQNRTSVNASIDKIFSKQFKVSDFPIINVVQRNGRYYSVDNRRLYVFRVLHVEGLITTVPVSVVNYNIRWHQRKFTTRNDGLSVIVRRDVTYQHVTSSRLPQGQIRYSRLVSMISDLQLPQANKSHSRSDAGHQAVKSRVQSSRQPSALNARVDNDEFTSRVNTCPFTMQGDKSAPTLDRASRRYVSGHLVTTKEEFAFSEKLASGVTTSECSGSTKISWRSPEPQLSSLSKQRIKKLLKPSEIMFSIKDINEDARVYQKFLPHCVSTPLTNRSLHVLLHKGVYYCFPNRKNNIHLYFHKVFEHKGLVDKCETRVKAIDQALPSYTKITFGGKIPQECNGMDELTRCIEQVLQIVE